MTSSPSATERPHLTAGSVSGTWPPWLFEQTAVRVAAIPDTVPVR